MFFKEIKIGYSDFEQLISNANATENYIKLYSERKFYIGDTGINRKTLKDWEIAGLLPYECNEEGWRKFSFIEWIWLKCIHEFRKLGVSLDKIREVKQMLFQKDLDDLIQFLKDNIEGYKGKSEFKDKFIAGMNDPELMQEMRNHFFEAQVSIFLFLVIGVVTSEQNYCLVYSENFCTIFILGNVKKEMQAANDGVISNLVNESFLVVNLRKIVTELFQEPDLRHNDNFILDFLSPNEKKIIDHIRKANAKEIVISFDSESNPIQIKVTRNRISRETINKVARYLKKGTFQHISFKTRDGQLITYDETDIIKI